MHAARKSPIKGQRGGGGKTKSSTRMRRFPLQLRILRFAIGDNSFDGEKKKKTDEKVEAKRIQLVQENVEREAKKARDKWTGKSGEEKMAKEEGKGPLWRPYCIPLTGRPSDLDPISHRDGALLLPLPIPQTQT